MTNKDMAKPVKLDHERLVLTVPEAAAMLGLSVRSTYTLCKRADFPAIWLTPRRVGVSRPGLEQWVASRVGTAMNI